MNHRDILARLSTLMLGDATVAATISDEIRNSSWLGYPGCNDRQIADVESRLGVTFPPSLREFYSITNGWQNVNSFVDAILPIEQIDYLPIIAPELTAIIRETGELPNDPEYTDEQVTRVVRSIVLSTEGDATTTLIDPESDIGNGEWNVGAWASWHPAMEWADLDWWSYLASQGPTETVG